MNLRFASVKILSCVILQGHSLSDVLAEEKKIDRDDAFIQAICYGVCRWYPRLQSIANQLLEKPLNKKDGDIYLLILVGIYQLKEMRVPEHAALFETVEATKRLKKNWAKNVVNAVLRKYQREKLKIEEALKKTPAYRYAYPDWWIEKIRADWPDFLEKIIEASNQHPPFSLRVNQRKYSREHYLTLLQEKNISAHSIPNTRSGIVIDTAMPVTELPGFQEGTISVQDGAAQLAAELLQLFPHQRVLDACAAPGGKTTHILEWEPELSEVVAVDQDEKRCQKIKENLHRLHLSATCIVIDVKKMQVDESHYFDRILLDAPCSASGIVRRHPDIKLLRKKSDILFLAEEQKKLLHAVWKMLKVNGLLVYATCSIFPEENVQVIKHFLANHPEAKEEKMPSVWGIACEIGRQILPGMHEMDGFYYACLRKI